MAAKKSKNAEIVDPVLPDQGGRMMSSDPAHPTALISEEVVRVRAYEIYERRGRRDGQDLDDWLSAESQVVR
jgi:Protein of unknown function (DUF2934)